LQFSATTENTLGQCDQKSLGKEAKRFQKSPKSTQNTQIVKDSKNHPKAPKSTQNTQIVKDSKKSPNVVPRIEKVADFTMNYLDKMAINQ
jgi:hypothetical protein